MERTTPIRINETPTRQQQSPTLVHYTKYTEESLLSCLRVLSPWLTARSQTLQAIRKKYGSHKFMAVSALDLDGVC